MRFPTQKISLFPEAHFLLNVQILLSVCSHSDLALDWKVGGREKTGIPLPLFLPWKHRLEQPHLHDSRTSGNSPGLAAPSSPRVLAAAWCCWPELFHCLVGLPPASHSSNIQFLRVRSAFLSPQTDKQVCQHKKNSNNWLLGLILMSLYYGALHESQSSTFKQIPLCVFQQLKKTQEHFHFSPSDD